MRVKKPEKSRNSDWWIYYVVVISVALTVWEIEIFRMTFISIWIPLCLFISGGVAICLLLRNKIKHYAEGGPVFLVGLAGTFLFGAILTFSFMALNYYIPSDQTEIKNLEVIKTGTISVHRRRRRIGQPYAIVIHDDFEKQLIFKYGTCIKGSKSVNVALRKGFFGFHIIDEMHAIIPADYNAQSNNDKDFDIQYSKLLNKAEESYHAKNYNKSLELYKRALTFKPTDTIPKNRIKEIHAFLRN